MNKNHYQCMVIDFDVLVSEYNVETKETTELFSIIDVFCFLYTFCIETIIKNFVRQVWTLVQVIHQRTICNFEVKINYFQNKQNSQSCYNSSFLCSWGSIHKWRQRYLLLPCINTAYILIWNVTSLANDHSHGKVIGQSSFANGH